ncbi:hypothetical protein ACR8AL_06090 [Clavibacter sepedonicus]|uniref:hypothetical protein n=1 Tax=Clavibacter sepedonicus TaxID=31964 RepID=UPI000300C955|nr:hypothetical protein [Clavibacter sepedonicus]OQJ47471.1 hypothetical protein B5P19_03655 [Clavibacter sepedonicus]OQJ53026.1 hypothetical protein B5P20_01915 [Clavibacter sepedonicus]
MDIVLALAFLSLSSTISVIVGRVSTRPRMGVSDIALKAEGAAVEVEEGHPVRLAVRDRSRPGQRPARAATRPTSPMSVVVVASVPMDRRRDV